MQVKNALGVTLQERKAFFLNYRVDMVTLYKKLPEYWPNPGLTILNIFRWPCGNPAFWLIYNVGRLLSVEGDQH